MGDLLSTCGCTNPDEECTKEVVARVWVAPAGPVLLGNVFPARPNPPRKVPRSTSSLSRAASEANATFRAYHEDRSVIIDPFLVEPNGDAWGYFAVYDGHGGSEAVDAVKAQLHILVLDELVRVTRAGPVTDAVVAGVLTRAFRRVDEQLKLLGPATWQCGCTATVVLSHRTAARLRLHVGVLRDL
ncbi:PTC1 [Symbiodinium sp. CCMP2456]|nr:PTC1 [Symbiodinium sp. CCMP2456]